MGLLLDFCLIFFLIVGGKKPGKCTAITVETRMLLILALFRRGKIVKKKFPRIFK